MKRRIFQGFICLHVLVIGAITNAGVSSNNDPLYIEIRRAMLRGGAGLDYLSTQSAVGQIVAPRSRFFLTEDNRTTRIVGPADGIITTETVRLKSSGYTTDVVTRRPIGW